MNYEGIARNTISITEKICVGYVVTMRDDDFSEESSRWERTSSLPLPSSNLVCILAIYDVRPAVRCRTRGGRCSFTRLSNWSTDDRTRKSVLNYSRCRSVSLSSCIRLCDIVGERKHSRQSSMGD